MRGPSSKYRVTRSETQLRNFQQADVQAPMHSSVVSCGNEGSCVRTPCTSNTSVCTVNRFDIFFVEVATKSTKLRAVSLLAYHDTTFAWQPRGSTQLSWLMGPLASDIHSSKRRVICSPTRLARSCFHGPLNIRAKLPQPNPWRDHARFLLWSRQRARRSYTMGRAEAT